MTLASDYFKAGISIAPNVEPLLYDTIWTERYMGLVEENPEGYKNASVLTHVDKAKGHLLQIHGNADDNVHHQHSINLQKRMQNMEKIWRCSFIQMLTMECLIIIF